MRRWGLPARRASVLLLLLSFLLPYATVVRADGPAIASLPIPVGPGTLTNARISGPLLVWQDPTGVFGVNLSNGQPLPLQAGGGSDPDVSGTLIVWKQGASAIRGFDTATNTPFNVPVGDAKVFAPSVSDGTLIAWLAQDANGIAVLVWDRDTNATTEAGRVPAARVQQETLGQPHVWGRRLAFPDITSDPTHLSRMILFDVDSGQRLPVNDAFGGPGAVFGFAQNRLALAQGNRILVYDFGTNAVEAFPANVSGNQQVNSLGFDGATVVWSTSPDSSGTTSVFGYDLARHIGFGIDSGHDANVGPTVSGNTVVWSHAGGLVAKTITFPDQAPQVVVRQDYRYFPETGFIVGNGFLTFWNANGGEPIFGLPLTNEVVDSSSKLTVQYFERSRFEWHPETSSVQLTNVGRILTAGRTDPALNPQPLVPAGTERAYYVQTQHSIGGLFKRFFDQNGGVFIFGYPISEENIEANPTDGVVYTVQWFERARFEYHPETGDGTAIGLGQLGRQLLLGQTGLYRPECSPLYIQKPILPECR